MVALFSLKTMTGPMGGFSFYFGGLALWSVLRDCGPKLGTTPIRLVRPLVRSVYGDIILGNFRPLLDGVTFEDLDGATEMLAGGPMSGLLLKMFR